MLTAAEERVLEHLEDLVELSRTAAERAARLGLQQLFERRLAEQAAAIVAADAARRRFEGDDGG